VKLGPVIANSVTGPFTFSDRLNRVLNGAAPVPSENELDD